jgi:hypothetical protein
MRKTIGSIIAALGLLAVSSVAEAQTPYWL